MSSNVKEEVLKTVEAEKVAEVQVECQLVIEKDEIGSPVNEVNSSIDAKSVAGSSRLSTAPDVGKTTYK